MTKYLSSVAVSSSLFAMAGCATAADVRDVSLRPLATKTTMARTCGYLPVLHFAAWR